MSPRKQSFFPEKLYDMLEDAEKKSFDHIVSWMPSGTGFKIHNPRAFVRRTLPEYFPQQTRYRSFTRQLNLYMFKMFIKNEDSPEDEDDHHWGDNDVGSYVHPNFVRGQRDMCLDIIRKKKKTKTKTKTENEDCLQAAGLDIKKSPSSTTPRCRVYHQETAPAPVSCYFREEDEEGPQQFGITAIKEKVVDHHIPQEIEFFASGVKQGEGGHFSNLWSSYPPSSRQDATGGDDHLVVLEPASSAPLGTETVDKPFCSSPDVTTFSLKTAGGGGAAPLDDFSIYSIAAADHVDDMMEDCFLHGFGEEGDCRMPDELSSKDTAPMTFDTFEALLGRHRQQEEEEVKTVSTSFAFRPGTSHSAESSLLTWFADQEKLLLDFAQEASGYILQDNAKK